MSRRPKCAALGMFGPSSRLRDTAPKVYFVDRRYVPKPNASSPEGKRLAAIRDGAK